MHLAATTHPALRFLLVHRPIGPADPIAKVLRATGVTAVFSGHLHRYERMTFAEIAAALGTTEGAVKLRAFRAYQRLRVLLAPLAGKDDVA